jgi:hypothetical protein
MKKINYLIFAVLFLTVACKKDKTDFVDSYAPTLTEAAKTTYTGDFYPFATGYQWNWSGQSTTTGSMTTSYNGQSSTEAINETDPVTGYMYVNGSQSLTLPSGTYNVLSTNETDNTTRYFEVKESGVYIRAIKLSSMSSPAEVKNPVFIKKPLVVGDKWACEPSVDYNQLLNSSDMEGLGDMNITTKCELFVLGKENINWQSSSTSTMALEEVATITGKISINESGATGSVNMNFTMDARLNLKENVGLVKQTMKLKGTLSGSLSGGGESASIKMTINMDGTMTLDSYYLSGTGKPQTLKSAASGALQKSTGNVLLDKQISKAMTAVKNIQKSLIFK